MTSFAGGLKGRRVFLVVALILLLRITDIQREGIDHNSTSHIRRTTDIQREGNHPATPKQMSDEAIGRLQPPQGKHPTPLEKKIAILEITKLKKTTSSPKEFSTSSAYDKIDANVSITIDWPKLLIKGCDFSSEKLVIRNETTSNLMQALDCGSSRIDTTKKTVNFFSSATKEKYEDLLPLYAFAALSSNDDAVVEIVVTNATTFINRKHDILTWLSKFSSQRSGMICVRNYDNSEPIKAQRQKAVDNTFRYLEVPHVVTNYTYIGDVDLFITESVLDPKRFKQMDFFKIPYSNIIRPNSTRLTGLMLVDTSKSNCPTAPANDKGLPSKGSSFTLTVFLAEEKVFVTLLIIGFPKKSPLPVGTPTTISITIGSIVNFPDRVGMSRAFLRTTYL